MRLRVALSKTVPLSLLEAQRHDPHVDVRAMVRAKATWVRAHPEAAPRLRDAE